MAKPECADIIIAGGGLAGLCLAQQIRQRHNDMDILVLEKNRFPVPEAIAKVGESTVEIGAHYLGEVIGLKEHLDRRHLRKFGLRCFFGEAGGDLAQQDELGASRYFGIPTYQIDRGVLENHLHERLLGMGVRISDGVATESVELCKGGHQVRASGVAGPTTFQGRWLLDASGRRGLVRRHLGLDQGCGHRGNAVWFRVDRRLIVDQWSRDPAWRARCDPRDERWLSTNHFMGPGYWVWVIPLRDDITSIGIVMDDEVLAQADLDSPEACLRWLTRHQPQCAAALEGARTLDFCQVRDYAFGCRQVFSGDGWGLTGEAGVFTDPFYSPGSDFIAIANRYLADLIDRERRGGDIHFNAAIFQKFFDSIFASTLSLYTGEYGVFGDRRVMGIKVLWDFAYYWGVLSLLFFRDAMSDVSLMRKGAPVLLLSRQLNADLQARFRQLAGQRMVRPAKGAFLDIHQVPCLQQFNSLLQRPGTGDCNRELADNVAVLEQLAGVIHALLDGKAADERERELIGDYGKQCR